GEQRACGEVEQPGGDHAAATPELGDVAHVEVVLILLGMTQRRRLRVDRVLGSAGVGVMQDVQALGVGGHDAVLDAVVNHLHEMAGAGRPTVQIAVLGRAADPLAPRQPRRRLPAGRQRGEDRKSTRLHSPYVATSYAVLCLQKKNATSPPGLYAAPLQGSTRSGTLVARA